MNKTIILLAAATLFAMSATAQRKAKPAVKTAEETLYDELLLSTAKVMFIDSLVCDKDSFLLYLPLPKDAGTLATDGGATVYTNEFGDTRIIASGDSLDRKLHIMRRYGKEWDSPDVISELDNALPDYPFLMADGVTLYFSAEGEGTVGGRDIFRTVYNADALEFYEATNVGLPYNSPANDYLLAISDIDNIGWLVSDRNQEPGRVCIYTFEPPAQRLAFDEETPDETLRRYAEIRRIADTWTFGDADAALKRQSDIIDRMDSNDETRRIAFVVNNRTVYTSLDDFPDTAARQQFQTIEDAKKKLEMLGTLLDSMRTSYAATTGAKRYETGRKIAELEAETASLTDEITQAEKSLRNALNK